MTAEQSAIAKSASGISDHAMTGAWRVIVARKPDASRTWYYHTADDHRIRAACRAQAERWIAA